MGIIERKKNFRVGSKKWGWSDDSKQTYFFFWPYTFWFASFISFGLVRSRKNIVVTCVSGSLPKIIRIGRSTQLFYFIFWVCAKNLRSVGEPETLFSWPYLQECRLPLHNARPTLKNFCFPLPISIKKRGSVEYVISERGKKNSKTCDSERYQFNQLNFFKMLQTNLNLEYVENNIIVQQTHLTAKYEFC